MLLTEILLSIAVILMSLLFPRAGARWFDKGETCFRRFAEKKARSVLTVGVLAVVARVAVLPVLPVPNPAVHDEFSYLLMSDTFAHGRLANPTPAMWVHFETFHENMEPTYVSKYYPAQGAFLAIGQVLLGNPFWGVVLSTALMCAAICWMLQGWTSPAWALLGGIFAVIRFGMFSYWADSYWGGAVTALGGALVLGAYRRISESHRPQDAIWLGIGAALLVNSRPYEAIFLIVPVMVALLVRISRRTTMTVARALKRVVLPAGIVLSLTIGFMMFYFWKTTGNAFRPPYIINDRTYYLTPPFPWMHVRPTPVYSSEALRNFYAGSVPEEYKFARDQVFLAQSSRILVIALFYFGPLFAVPIFALSVVLPYGASVRDLPFEVRFLIWSFVSTCVGMALPAYFAAHYAAAITSVMLAFVILSLGYIRAWRPHDRPVGLALVRYVSIAVVLLVPIRAFAPRLGIPLSAPRFKTWASESYALPERAAINRKLMAEPGLQLVIARDGTDPNHFDWVYNGADIDSDKVIWARDLGPEKNQELIDHYNNRRVWIVDTETTPPKLAPYR